MITFNRIVMTNEQSSEQQSAQPTKSLTGWLSDVTSDRTIANYLLRDPAILACVEVIKKDLSLETVADAFYRGDEGDNAIVKKWLESKSILLLNIIDMNNRVIDNAVDCIRLEPFYIFKD